MRILQKGSIMLYEERPTGDSMKELHPGILPAKLKRFKLSYMNLE